MSCTGEFVKILEVLYNGTFNCELYERRYYENVFMEPSQSKHFNIVFLNMNRCRPNILTLRKKDLIRKVIALKYKDKIYLSALCHDIIH